MQEGTSVLLKLGRVRLYGRTLTSKIIYYEMAFNALKII